MNTTDNPMTQSFVGFLSIERVVDFAPGPYLDIDCGQPFDIIPDGRGVIVLIGKDFTAIQIDACQRSMRERTIDHYKGMEGKLSASAALVAYEPCSNPSVRQAELVQEHRAVFGTVPLKNRA